MWHLNNGKLTQRQKYSSAINSISPKLIAKAKHIERSYKSTPRQDRRVIDECVR